MDKTSQVIGKFCRLIYSDCHQQKETCPLPFLPWFECSFVNPQVTHLVLHWKSGGASTVISGKKSHSANGVDGSGGWFSKTCLSSVRLLAMNHWLNYISYHIKLSCVMIYYSWFLSQCIISSLLLILHVILFHILIFAFLCCFMHLII